MKENKQPSRRKFIQQTTLAGAGLMLASPQEVMDYCAENKIYPQIQIINADEMNFKIHPLQPMPLLAVAIIYLELLLRK